MPNRRCITPRCPNPVVPGRSRCRKHGSGSSWDGYAERHPERVLAYKGPGWQVARARQLREHPDCIRCGRPATHADHITAIADGGSFEGALESMCAPCHRAKTAEDAKRRAQARGRQP